MSYSSNESKKLSKLKGSMSIFLLESRLIFYNCVSTNDDN